MANVWWTEDLPFLQAVQRLEALAEPGLPLDMPSLAAAADMPLNQAKRLTLRLGKAHYLHILEEPDYDGWDGRVEGLAEKGRRAVGQWPPDDAWAGLVALLEQRIDNEPDENTRTRLSRLRDGVVAAGREVSTSLLTAYLQQQAGLN